MILEPNYKSEHIVKDILKKYLALLGSVIYALLIVNIITNHTYTGFFYYAFLILHSISFCAGLFIFFNPSKNNCIRYSWNMLSSCPCFFQNG